VNQTLFRLAAVLCLVVAGSFCFHRFACNRRSPEESIPHLLPAGVGEFLKAAALRDELEARAEMNHRRILAKHEVVTALLGRRLTLVEAAARFRDLDAGLPELRERLLQQYPGVSYELAQCRNVIENARSELQLRALEQVESVVARLEAELQAQLECETGLRLP
jgi:hypothetical protein